MSLRRSIATVVTALLVVAFGSACGGEDDRPESTHRSDLISRGRDAFEANCAACHGKDLEGTKAGPPFLDPIYAPDHHPDEAFFSAVENGVQPHHWKFGPMPPQPAVSEDQVEQIVAYVRSRQEEAGIIEDPAPQTVYSIRPTRRKSLRATDLDGNELVFAFSISKKLYRCPGCRESLDVGREHTLVKYLSGPSGTFHQHWHTECAAEHFKREVRNVKEISPR